MAVGAAAVSVNVITIIANLCARFNEAVTTYTCPFSIDEVKLASVLTLFKPCILCAWKDC